MILLLLCPADQILQPNSAFGAIFLAGAAISARFGIGYGQPSVLDRQNRLGTHLNAGSADSAFFMIDDRQCLIRHGAYFLSGHQDIIWFNFCL